MCTVQEKGKRLQPVDWPGIAPVTRTCDAWPLAPHDRFSPSFHGPKTRQCRTHREEASRTLSLPRPYQIIISLFSFRSRIDQTPRRSTPSIVKSSELHAHDVPHLGSGSRSTAARTSVLAPPRKNLTLDTPLPKRTTTRGGTEMATHQCWRDTHPQHCMLQPASAYAGGGGFWCCNYPHRCWR